MKTQGNAMEMMRSYVNNYNLFLPNTDARIDEYNGKITELVKRLHKNALDYKE